MEIFNVTDVINVVETINLNMAYFDYNGNIFLKIKY
jgi:hypothetical protein